ncbi:NAD(P)/FAD-dependent oxidoreductase [Ramlibacter ginsenosidimutans]|uniref:NAD(P)/FAD-dependent oxidoreductase n=1 Tax=Ramlibacter ginsenosidimutans TaxID=502333 RepID=A0A934WNE4_9BURK|nr:NAD(P)/FAD-dependent oxidoreductase [Ramlibacter ginsenosidimutans]MBK6007596.1 NAD(P)/FAD-dependent oxidoreductase [Ramlibacter ginsenosidimutans]
MLRITELRLPLDHAEDALRPAVARRLGVDDADLLSFNVFRRAYDARKKSAILLIYTVDCEVRDEAAVLAAHPGDPHLKPAPDTRYRFVAHAPADFQAQERPRPIVVGFGPCGIFAALLLAQMGLRPIVLERGKEVRQRTKDTWGLWRRSVLNPESNVQFGEGGAGTFSDGKLWSQISDPRHLTRKVLTEFVKAGAPEEILFVSKPHIGTFRLVSMVEKMRADIVALGGEIRFGQQVIDVLLEREGNALHLRGVTLASGEQLRADHVVLALGHSARDTFTMLHERGVFMEAKPFSVGFRIEHPQGVIDRARFGPNAGNPILGAADYKLVHHAKNGRGVYSFCMCPGGTVVAATSEPQRVVTNGMSQYSRNERNANAGIVVGISPQDYRQDGAAAGPVNPLDGMRFQRLWESRAYELGEGDYFAPGQLVGDFVKRQRSSAVGNVLPSYKPGVRCTDLAQPGRESLPVYVLDAIREAIPAFDRQIAGFAMRDAVLTGVETRTSSPLRITRNRQYESLNVRGLYPAGEGAGYAGGIMSAGVDGIEVAEAVARAILGIAPDANTVHAIGPSVLQAI